MDNDTKQVHIGVMVAFFLPSAIAQRLALTPDQLPAGSRVLPPEELHLTLAYLGDSSELGEAAHGALQEALGVWVQETSVLPVTGVISGIGRFTPGEGNDVTPVYASFDSPALAEWRLDLVDQLLAITGPASDHGFDPHITLAYIPADAPMPDIELMDDTITFDVLTLAWGDEHTAYLLEQAMTTRYLTEDDLRKAGARHSAADQEMLQRIHDDAVALGAMCTPSDDIPKQFTRASSGIMRKNVAIEVIERTKAGGRIRISTASLDRDRDRVLPSGARIEHYLKNPIVQWGHNYWDPWATIGRTRSLEVTATDLVAEFELRPAANEYDPQNIIIMLWEGGWVRTASIGFNPHNALQNAEGGRDFTEWELLEWSLVPIPANQEALRQETLRFELPNGKVYTPPAQNEPAAQFATALAHYIETLRTRIGGHPHGV